VNTTAGNEARDHARPPFRPEDLYVFPRRGWDEWCGGLAEPAADGSDGPIATITRARDLIRQRKGSGLSDANASAMRQDYSLPITVWLREGEYLLDEPLVFDDRDSGM